MSRTPFLKLLITASAAILLGASVGAGVTYLLVDSHDATNGASDPHKPLYWVAPMDPNFRRVQPGLSPMGMELVPVYEGESPDGGTEPGTVRITPDVVNNLGVRTALVGRGKLNPEIHTVGYVEYNQDKLIHINPRIAGWVERLYVSTTGDRVTTGDPLYALYSPELVNAQQEFLQALDQGGPHFIRAAEDRLKTWQISEEFIKQLRNTKKIQQTVVYFAPTTGHLEALNIRQGEFVEPGKVLMSIATLEDIWVEAAVFASQAHFVAAGTPVSMTLDFLPGEAWQGHVDYIYPTINEITRTLPVRLTFPNQNGTLKPGMFASVTIHSQHDSETTLVPREAVIRTGNMDRVVLALGEGRFKSVAVTLGRSDDEFMEILEGLKIGDRVVKSAQFLLDSESRKTADFTRMHHGHDQHTQAMDQAEATPQTVHTEAIINEVMADHHMLNVTHEPIAAWDWPAMTMDFAVSEAIDLTALKPGLRIGLDIQEHGNGDLTIIRIEIVDDEAHSHD